jgi:aminopeptidase YwaD
MCNTTSINETNSNKKAISIFPNPANTEINIVVPLNENSQIEISNAMGQVIFKDDNKTKIDISNLPNGLYIVSVKQGQQSYTQKLIKQ